MFYSRPVQMKLLHKSNHELNKIQIDFLLAMSKMKENIGNSNRRAATVCGKKTFFAATFR